MYETLLIMFFLLMQAHPDAQCYKKKSLVNFDDLCLIYAYTTADGRYSRSSHDVDLDDDIQGMNIGIYALPFRLHFKLGFQM